MGGEGRGRGINATAMPGEGKGINATAMPILYCYVSFHVVLVVPVVPVQNFGRKQKFLRGRQVGLERDPPASWWTSCILMQ